MTSPLSEAIKVIPCREYGIIDVDPSEILNSSGQLMLADGVLGKYVQADFKDRRLRLSAKGGIGLIPLTDRVMAQVRPRFPLKNLTHMVTACGYQPTSLSAFRDYVSSAYWADWLLDVLADALLRSIEVIRKQGLLRVYVQRTDSSTFPHGRINATRTATRIAARGINHRADYSWFERTTDNAPNQLLKSALLRLHAHYSRLPRRKGVREWISRIADALLIFREVRPDPQLRSLRDPQVRGARPLPEPRGYYRPALGTAEAILTMRGISLDPFLVAKAYDVGAPFNADPGPLHGFILRSLLVKTDNLFEDFVRLSLRAAFSQDPDIHVLDGNKEEGSLPLYTRHDAFYFEGWPKYEIVTADGKAPSTEPDIVFRRPDGSHPLIADVKYTNVEGLADRSEVEQVMLYGARYESPIVMTIHPKKKSAKRGLHIAGRIGSTLVTQYRIDLGNDDLEAEMSAFASDLRVLLSSGRVRPLV